LQTLVCKKR